MFVFLCAGKTRRLSPIGEENLHEHDKCSDEAILFHKLCRKMKLTA